MVAMSGGVDSSVAAGLLLEQGYDVFGVTLHLWDAQGEQQVGRCCSPEDRDDALRSCQHLGIAHYVMDERQAFRTQVVDPFLETYLQGATPAPCVTCNQQVKLGRLWELARAFGASAIATGHYARVAPAAPGEVHLLRGRDRDKDQSYFLFGVSNEVLSRCIFPLGEMPKGEARGHAKRLGLPNWNKPDSQELCFVPDGNVGAFVGRERPGSMAKGAIKDTDGITLGSHDGIAGYTVGQRRGLGVSGPVARYVLRIVPERNELVVGDADALLGRQLRVQSVHWSGEAPREPFAASVRIRHRHEPAAALVRPEGDGFTVEFEQAQRAIAPGQAAVVYVGERVLGGGTIVDSPAVTGARQAG